MREIAVLLVNIATIGTFVAELWLGIAVAGWTGDNMVVERKKQPGPYWFTIALHTILVIAVPLLSSLVYGP